MVRPKSSRSNALSQLSATLPGLVLADKYVVERVIGEGGMAFVVAARHRELDELVAIKFLKPDQQNEEVVRRFAREAKAMAKLKSQYITRIHDVGMSLEHGPYIVMELLQGENLGAVLERLGPLPVRMAVDLTIQAAMALAEAHSRGIVHRDVKPENIFLHAQNGSLERATVKLVDFGVSKASLTGTTFGTSVEFARTTTLVGSPLYMAPEQIRARADVDHRADIWGLGVVLYELLTNESPFLASSIPELSARILESEPRALTELRPEAPEELSQVLAVCLAKEPSERYQTMAELGEALAPLASPAYAHLVASFPTEAPSEGAALVDSGSRDAGRQSDPGVAALRRTNRPGAASSRPPAEARASAMSGQTSTDLSTSQGPASQAAPGGSNRGTMVAVGLALLALLGVGALLLRPAPTAPAAPPVSSAMAVNTAVPIELRSDPSGASVEIDGAARGTTPVKLTLTPGTHSVKLALDGHAPASLVVPVPSIGEVPPLPAITLRPDARPAVSAAATTSSPADKNDQADKRPRNSDPPAARPAVEPPTSKTAAPAASPTSRPRVIEDKSNVKIIE